MASVAYTSKVQTGVAVPTPNAASTIRELDGASIVPANELPMDTPPATSSIAKGESVPIPFGGGGRGRC